MNGIGPLAVPVVVVFTGALIILTAIYYGSTGAWPEGDFEQYPENAMWILIGIGVLFVLVGTGTYFWERNRLNNETEQNALSRLSIRQLPKISILPLIIVG